MKTKRIIKIPLIIIGSIAALYLLFVGYIKITNIDSPRPLFMDYRYNAVITEPLAKIGFTDSQYKMGVSWYCEGVGPLEDERIYKPDLEKAIYWWERAAKKGDKRAIEEYAKAKKQLEDGKYSLTR